MSNNKTKEWKSCFSKSALAKRGWTQKAIKLFLKSPDGEAINMYHRSGPTVKLFLIERVEEIEKTKEFQDFLQKSNKRKEASKKATQTKREKLLQYIEELQINLKKKDVKKTTLQAIRHYNDFKSSVSLEQGCYDEYEPASLDSDPHFLRRITVNYIRHQLSSYEDILGNIFGKVGTAEAYEIIRETIDREIEKIYPELFESLIK